MSFDEALLLDAGWFFFAAWTLILLVVTVVAFGKDLLSSASFAKKRSR
jgi:hypothetical protein